MYLLKLALRPWRVALLSQLFSALALGSLLVILGFIFWMHEGARSILTRLQSEQTVSVYLSPKVSAAEEKQLVTRVSEIAEKSRLKMTFLGSKEFIRSLEGSYPDLAKELSGLEEESQSLIPRSLHLSGMVSSKTLDEVKKMRGVESVESTRDGQRSAVSAFRALQWLLRILMLGIGLAVFTGLVHLCQMNQSFFRESLRLLELWGANRWVLTLPTFASGVLVGLVGGALAWLGWSLIGAGGMNHLRALSPVLESLPSYSSRFGAGLGMLGLLSGQAAGVFGSFLKPARNEA